MTTKQPTDVFQDSEHWRPKMVMEPSTTYRHRVPIDKLTTRITPNSDIFVLSHFGVPRIELNDWRLHFSGMFDRARAMTIEDVYAFPKHQIEAFIKCAGFPADHRIATRNASNAIWAGARLTDILEEVGLSPEASFLWFYAPDYGSYGRWSADRYLKDLSVERATAGDVLLAYEVNGESLSAEHGFPLRVLVPGYYGTNSVKWLCRIDAAKTRSPDIFTQELYNDPIIRDGEPSGTSPVWGVAPEALIVTPANGAKVVQGDVDVSGWCWGQRAIDEVQLSVDQGASWLSSRPEARSETSWQKFIFRITANRTGKLDVMVRALDEGGETQPFSEARNSIHRIELTVE